MNRLSITVLFLLLSILSLHATRDVMLPFFQKKASDATLPPVERLAAFDSLLTRAQTPETRRQALYQKGLYCFEIGKLHSATETYDELRKDMSAFSTHEKCRILYGVIMTHMYFNDFQTSIQAINELRQIPKADSLSYYDALCLLNEGAIYFRNERLDLAKEKIKEAFKNIDENSGLYDKNTANDIVARLHVMQSNFQGTLRSPDKALEELDMAEKFSQSASTKLAVNLNKGVLYLHLGKPDIAEYYFSNILNNSPLAQYNTGLTVLNYMSALCTQNRYNEALEAYHKYSGYLDLIKNSPDEPYIYGNLSLIYGAKDDWKQAYSMLNEYVRLTDSLTYEHNRLLAHTFDAESSRNAKVEKEHRTQLILCIVAIILLAVGLCITVIILYRKNRRLQAVNAQNISTQAQYLAANIDSETADRASELTSLALQLSRYNETINAIQADIDDASLEKDDKIEAVRRSLRDIKLLDNAWEMFDKYFANAHRGFLSRLCSRHPDLTAVEIRMCALMVLNLNTKDIADITKRSVRTVESTKYRINKKLGLDQPLNIYLHSLL